MNPNSIVVQGFAMVVVVGGLAGLLSTVSLATLLSSLSLPLCLFKVLYNTPRRPVIREKALGIMLITHTQHQQKRASKPAVSKREQTIKTCV